MRLIGRLVALALLGVADWMEGVASEILFRVEPPEPVDPKMNGDPSGVPVMIHIEEEQ